MTPYTDEQKADLAKRIEARAERLETDASVADKSGQHSETAHSLRCGMTDEDDDDWGCEYCRNDGKLDANHCCPKCGAEFWDWGDGENEDQPHD